MTKYPRDMVGYGAAPQQMQWLGDAHIASQIVLNYEEGAENDILLAPPPPRRFSPRSPARSRYRGSAPGAVSPLPCRAEGCHLYIALTSFVGAR
jgi:hypothetical protein